MKKLSRLVLCLTLILVVGMSAVLLAACDKDTAETPVNTVTKYKVTFYSNYPTDETANSTLFYSVSVNSGAKILQSSVGEVTRPAGYVFEGWYYDAECTSAFDFNATITADVKAYAKWTSNEKSTDVSLSSEKLVEQTETVKYKETQDGSIVQKTKEVSTGVWKYKYSANAFAVPNNESSFNFVTKGFQTFINSKATYGIYTDAACKKTAGNPVALSNGDNYYYMKVTAEDQIATAIYKIDIYLAPVYKVIVDTLNNTVGDALKTKNVAAGAYLNANEFPTDGINAGYKFLGWYYQWPQKLDEYGRYVDADGNILERVGNYPDYVYYIVDTDGNRYPVYCDADGITAIREGSVYYKANKNGDYVMNDGNKVILSEAELFNVVDKNGLPTYEIGTPVTASSGQYECAWDFNKCAVDKSVTIYGKWEANTYTITFDLNAEQGLAEYHGDASVKVKYGIQAEALGNIIKNSCSGNMPTHKYARFLGWEYNDMLMVTSSGVGMSAWNIPADAKLKAKWLYNSYDVNVVANDAAMGEVSGSGSCVYGGNITATATAKAGYEFVNWTINGNPVSTSTSYKYSLNLDDLFNDSITVKANFRLVSINLVLDYKLANGEAAIEGAPTSITATYGASLYGTGANFLPVLENTSPNGQRLFVGWYFTYVNEEGKTVEVTLTDKNTPTDGNELWSAKVLTALKSVQTAGNVPTLTVKWNPNNYNVRVYNAVYNSVEMGSIVPVVTLPNNTTGTMLPISFDGENYILIDNYKLTGQEIRSVFGTYFSLTQQNANLNMYVFKGWYKVNLNAANPIDSLKEEDKMTDADLTAEGLQFTLGDQDVSIVAVWYYQPVTVSLFNADETAFTTPTVTVEIDKAFNLPLPESRDGYNFLGWASKSGKLYTNAQGGNVEKILNADFITAGFNLYAKWEKKNYFVVKDGVITGLTDDGKAKTALEIPSDDYITSIADGAFSGNISILELTVYGNITSIGASAFENSKLTKITFSGEFKGITIGARAFAGCGGLTSIAFPDGTDAIAAGALADCYKLTSVKYPADVPIGALFNTEEAEIGSWYEVEQNGMKYYVPTSLKTVSVTNTYTEICDYAFQNLVSVTTFNLAKPVVNSDKRYTQTIGRYSFSNTSEYALAHKGSVSVDISSIKSIGYCAFMDSAVTTVDFTSIEKLSTGAFKNSALTAASFVGTVLNTISANCFEGCKALTSVNYGSVKIVEQYAFANCDKYVTINSADNAGNIRIIGSYAYNGTGLNAASAAKMTKVELVNEYAFESTVAGSWYVTNTTGVMTIGKVLYLYRSGNPTANTAITSIAMGAFRNYNGTSLDLTGFTSLDTIYNSAFEGSGIAQITLPQSLETIRENAFSNCTHLTTVNMSACNKLRSIGTSAFSGCTSLTTVQFNAVATEEALATAVKLAIADKAFSGCSGLQTITLPDALASLGEYAFENCTSLTTVNFVKNAKYEATYTLNAETEKYEKTVDPVYTTTAGLISTIRKGTFKNCSALTSIELPYFVTSIQDYAFFGCSQLTSESNVYVSARDESNKPTYKTNMKTLGNYAFADNTSLTTIDMGADINLIGAAVFENCVALKSVSFKAVASIPDRAFNGCEELTSVTVATSISYVGEMAFQNCLKLSTLTATNGIAEVGAFAFKNCYRLYSLVLSSSGTATKIGDQAFNGCNSLISVTIPSSIETIGDGAFTGCTSLGSVSFASDTTLKTVGIGAFAGCIQLISITLPSSVETVGESAFANCSRLDNVTLGANVKYIGADAFANCGNLVVKLLAKNPPSIGGDLFDGSTATIYVPRGYKATYIAGDWEKYSALIIESAD